MAFPNIEAACYYLAALIDGEGCVSLDGIGHKVSRKIRISNNDPDIIQSCKEALEFLDISYKVYEAWKGNNNVYQVSILGRQNFEKVLRMVPIKATRKVNKLQEVVNSYKDRKDGKR